MPGPEFLQFCFVWSRGDHTQEATLASDRKFYMLTICNGKIITVDFELAICIHVAR